MEIAGRPRQEVEAARAVSRVAVLVPDHAGLQPRLLVEVGQRVRLGQPLIASRDEPELVLSAPGSGRVAEVLRDARRALLAVEIELDAEEEPLSFEVSPRAQLAGLPRADVVRRLLAAGMWAALRARPFGHVADPRSVPQALLVTAIDTHPLAASPEVVLRGVERDFEDGLAVLGRLLDGPLFLCTAEGSTIPGGDPDRVMLARFSGPHPAGLPGTHAHRLARAGRDRTTWHIGYQDVVAIGALFTTGRLSVERVVALAGPRVLHPRLLRTRLGADLDQLTMGELDDAACRVVSGSVLSGRQALGWGRYLGRFHLQVCALIEAEEAPWRPWQQRLFPWLARADTTALHGGPAHFLPSGDFERVLPLDLYPVPLLRALLVGDAEQAEALGCLELEEEDLALCTFACPSKQEYGAALRRVLDEIARAR